MPAANLEDRYFWREERNGAKVREGVLTVYQTKRLPIRFNSGSTPRHGVLDFVRLVLEHPEVWDRL